MIKCAKYPCPCKIREAIRANVGAKIHEAKATSRGLLHQLTLLEEAKRSFQMLQFTGLISVNGGETWVAIAKSGMPQCNDRMKGLACKRHRGHDGVHVHTDEELRVLMLWPNEKYEQIS